MAAMDATDRAVVQALRVGGRQSFAELGRAVRLSSSAAHDRVSKLEASGVIDGYRAVVDPRHLGLGVTALIGVQPGEYGRDDDIAVALEAMPEVESCYSVAGDEAFIVLVRVASVDELHSYLGRLRSISGVARTRTTVVLNTRFEGRPVSVSPETDSAADGAAGSTKNAPSARAQSGG